ncbi:hypothetical protein SK128_002757 [Halocaridina rubra]|uniref:Uncharacterized protein n=1 Tax=Halocaridina rubra TaxID=373956 RepID=A0AAN8X4N5_HALRR
MSFIAPMVAGIFTNNKQTLVQWQNLFWLCVPIYVLPEIFFLIFVSGTVQEWNYASSKEDKTQLELCLNHKDTERKTLENEKK